MNNETKAPTDKHLDVMGALKIVVAVVGLLAALTYASGWLDDRVEWLCDGVWVERPDGSTECIEGAVP